MKNKFIIAAITAAAVGTGLHFLYPMLPNLFTGLLAPVNESIWEHLKLLFWPTLGVGFFLSRAVKDRNALWGAVFAAVLVMPVALTGVYYLLRCGFGAESTVLNIGLYYLTVALGFWLAYHLHTSQEAAKRSGLLLMLVMLYGSALVLFTFAAPEADIFTIPVVCLW